MLLGATVPAEAATVVLIANSRLFYPKHRWDGSSESRKSRSRKPVRPVDPTNPDGPNPGTPGPLSIDYASSLILGVMRYRIRIKRILPERKPIEIQMVQQVN